MRDLLRECPELNGVDISPVDLEHPDLEKFYKELLGRLNGAGYF
jgi:hypothetical protein